MVAGPGTAAFLVRRKILLDSVTTLAAAFFIMGGSLFFFSGICVSFITKIIRVYVISISILTSDIAAINQEPTNYQVYLDQGAT